MAYSEIEKSCNFRLEKSQNMWVEFMRMREVIMPFLTNSNGW